MRSVIIVQKQLRQNRKDYFAIIPGAGIPGQNAKHGIV